MTDKSSQLSIDAAFKRRLVYELHNHIHFMQSATNPNDGTNASLLNASDTPSDSPSHAAYTITRLINTSISPGVAFKTFGEPLEDIVHVLTRESLKQKDREQIEVEQPHSTANAS